jgi:hypothetical protein
MNVVTTGKDTWDEMFQDIVRLANENQSFMDGTTEPVFAIMDGADIVWAVWQDTTLETGVGFRVLKGQEFLHRCVAEKRDLATVKWTGISCVEAAQAEALEMIYARRTLGNPALSRIGCSV